MSMEPRPGAEISPATVALETFLQASQSDTPIETYDELQEVLRGAVNVPALLAEYVKTNGKPQGNGTGEQSVYVTGKADKHIVTARVDGAGSDRERVVIYARRRTLPLMRYKQTKQVSLSTHDPTWDQAIITHPQREVFFPFHSSPTSIDFWASKGEHPVYGDDSGRPITTTAQIAREASAEAQATFQGFLDTTVWLVDHLLQAQRAKHLR